MSVVSARIEYGRTSTDEEGIASVVFKEPCVNTPEVFIQPRGTTASVPVVAKITSLNVSGFTVVLHKYQNSAMSVATNQTFSWVAIGG